MATFKKIGSLLSTAMKMHQPASCLNSLCSTPSKQFSSLVACRTTAGGGCLSKSPSTSAASSIQMHTPFQNSHSGERFQRFNHSSSSQGDEQFLEFLEQEIDAEKKRSKEVPNVSQFEVSSQGPEVILSREMDGETIKVQFVVTDSVNYNENLQEGNMLEDDPESSAEVPMTSAPDFTVTIAKQGCDKKLALRCAFTPQNDPQDLNEQQDERDKFDIIEVAMLDGEWSEKTYSVSGDLLDVNMYDMLMLMLEERGINHRLFADELQEFSMQYENEQYIKLLESLKGFLKA